MTTEKEKICKEYPYLLVEEDMGGTCEIIQHFKSKAEAEKALEIIDKELHSGISYVIKNHPSIVDKPYFSELNYDGEYEDNLIDRENWDNLSH